MSAPTHGFAGQFATGAHGLERLLRTVVVEVRSDDRSGGAGIVWGGAGLIVTNAHCAAPGAAMEVGRDGKWRGARLIAHHPRQDLALLSAPSVSGPLLEVRDAESLRIGELVFAHGHPLGMTDSLAMGVIHGVARDARTGAPRWVTADVRLAPGNSGGPLVDAEERLVGLNSMVVNGLGVAIPADVVRRFLERAVAARAA
jgi:serine protease Do